MLTAALVSGFLTAIYVGVPTWDNNEELSCGVSCGWSTTSMALGEFIVAFTLLAYLLFGRIYLKRKRQMLADMYSVMQ